MEEHTSASLPLSSLLSPTTSHLDIVEMSPEAGFWYRMQLEELSQYPASALSACAAHSGGEAQLPLPCTLLLYCL